MVSEHGAGRALIQGIGTALPPHRLYQDDVFAKIEASLREDPHALRWAKRIFKQCGVQVRYTCEEDFLKPADQCTYLSTDKQQAAPSTSKRMEVYRRESVPLAEKAAEEAMRDAGVEASGITHILTVSCTGQFLPGLDTVLIHRLGLSARIQRIPLTFQGCAAGLRAIQLAQQIVSASPAAVVLIVCVELCTIHLQPSGSREALFGASFFGDGASACIVRSGEADQQGGFQLDGGHSVLLPDSADEMIWEVGDTGFDLYLSPNIPKLLRTFLRDEVDRLLDGGALPPLWAIHPGGRGIVDAVQDLFGLEDSQTEFSRNVLRDFGNLSSATLLFVLKGMRERLREQSEGERSGVTLAFGPGLTAELLRFTYVPSFVTKQESSYEYAGL
ncbi:stilbene synthase [Paenibacillus sp. SSG-1]|uniref:type III polyketide synthase n=1 Tax=Paenibacillus sp. SSG-1 TaxID=1443669 RepID=UPI000B7DD4C8|nr:type III polyketide synthase [Paenibacillus sp. SSG-1]OXL87892.1 stilbene synthase [Paenibacillus sp. SSG-1]